MALLPRTDTGQGETISVRGGPVVRVSQQATDESVQQLNATEVSANIAHALEELQGIAVEVVAAQAALDERRARHGQQLAHLQRLQRRLNFLIGRASP